MVANRIDLTVSLSEPKTSITKTALPSKLDVASNQVLMINKAELLMTNEAKVLINLEDYPIHQAGAKRDQLMKISPATQIRTTPVMRLMRWRKIGELSIFDT